MENKGVMKSLQSLNMLDHFWFDESMEDETIHKSVLEIILGEKLQLLSKVESEKEFRTSPLLRSIRVDIYSMDDMKRIFSSEAQKQNNGNLPRRSRYYQALIDSSLLEPGCIDFNALNDVFLIVIAPFDLFGHNKYKYTFQYQCQELSNLMLGDGATRIFLNTRGTNDDEVSEELVQLLHYMECSTDEQASLSSPTIQNIHKRIKRIKSSEEVGVRYMQAWEEKVMEREAGRQEGIEAGRREGIEAIILDNMENGISEEIIVKKLIKRFALTMEEAKECCMEVKKQADSSHCS